MLRITIAIIITLVLSIPFLLCLLLVGLITFLGGRRYAINYYIGVDQLANAIIGSDPDETISSRAGKYLRSLPKDTIRWKIAYWLCLVLHKFDKNHCQDSIEEDEGQNAVIRSKKKKKKK